MNVFEIVVMFVCAFFGFVIIHRIGRSRHPFKRALLSFACGFAALMAVELTSGLTGVYLPFSLLTVAVSVIGGIPGLTALLALNLFF